MKRSTLITIIVVVVVAVGLTGWLIYENNQAVPSPNTQATQSVQSTNTPVQASIDADTAHNGLTYAQALAEYSNRIQFTSCQALTGVPANGTLSILAGKPFMLDNRGTSTIVVAFGPQSYTIPGDDFAIVTATAGYYPLTCNGGGSAYLQVAAQAQPQ